MARLEVDIEVDRAAPADGSEPLLVSGSVRRPDGGEAAFTGWVGLLSLLQQAVAGDAAR